MAFMASEKLITVKSTPTALLLSRQTLSTHYTDFCCCISASFVAMSIDKNKITTQDELGEPAPMDEADARAEAEMKKLEDQAKKDVAEGLRQTDE